MKKDNVVELSGRENHSDNVTELLRTGAQQLLQQACLLYTSDAADE